MGKTKKCITLLAIVCLMGCSTSDWRMKIIADMPATDMHVVQFAITDFDVKEKFVNEFLINHYCTPRHGLA